jgi:hypothetical protein
MSKKFETVLKYVKEISKQLGNASTTMRQIFVLDIWNVNIEKA